MIGWMGRQGPVATPGQHCPQMARRPGSKRANFYHTNIVYVQLYKSYKTIKALKKGHAPGRLTIGNERDFYPASATAARKKYDRCTPLSCPLLHSTARRGQRDLITKAVPSAPIVTNVQRDKRGRDKYGICGAHVSKASPLESEYS